MKKKLFVSHSTLKGTKEETRSGGAVRKATNAKKAAPKQKEVQREKKIAAGRCEKSWKVGERHMRTK